MLPFVMSDNQFLFLHCCDNIGKFCDLVIEKFRESV